MLLNNSEGSSDIVSALSPSQLVQCMSLLRAEIRQIAAAERRKLGGYIQAPATLNTTALVHELYLKLARSEGIQVRSQKHFFSLAALSIRQILVDHLRARSSQQRLQEDFVFAQSPALSADGSSVLRIDEALIELARVQPRLADVVNFRFFVGLSELETAQALELSDRTVRRDWEKAKAWLAIAMDA